MYPPFTPASSAQLLNVIYGFQLASCAYVAARLDVAEHLYTAPKSIRELAQLTHSDEAALYRVLKVLTGEGIFTESAPRTFAFNTAANALHGATHGSVKYFLLAILGEHSHAFGNMLHSVLTGATAFDYFYKEDVWQYYAAHPAEAENFNKAMAGLTQYYSAYIIPAYNFDDYETIIDIGGGNGALLFAILEFATRSAGIIFDAPHVIPQTEQLIRQRQLEQRCKAVAGNFFEAIIPGGDLYLFKYILHDWSDEQCLGILKNCAAAMKPGSRILILDSVLPEDDTRHIGRYMDVTMLACTRGKERTEHDFKTLLEAAGFVFNKVVNLPIDEVSLIEGTLQ